MPLPILNTPVYELTIPSTKEKIKYRPFLVKEQKALLIAQQSENEQTMINTLLEVVKNCVLDKIEIDKLAIFDIEYIFVQLRSVSVGEVSELSFSCLECKDPKAIMKINIDLQSVAVNIPKNHTNIVKLTDTIGMKLKYPTFMDLKNIDELQSDNIDAVFEIIINCIDSIYDQDNVYAAKDSTKEELLKFLNSLNHEQFQRIQGFFDTMPKLEKTIDFKCPVCKFPHKHTLVGMKSFF